MSIFKIVIKSENSQMIFFGNKENYETHLTESEKRITKENIIFSDYRIYPDDTIQTIKNKILLTLNFPICYEEIYLYGQEDLVIEFNTISHLLDERAFKKNVKNVEDDVYSVKKLVGNKYEGTYDYTFPVEPFNYRESDKVLFDLENSVLLSFLSQSNKLYCCLCEDVLSTTDNNEIIKLYYPLLYSKNVFDVLSLKTQREELIENNKKKIPNDLLKLYECVNIYHQINDHIDEPLEYKQIGIDFFDISIRSHYKILPLDAIFKCIHATKDVPYIKYNPGFRRDTLYRLYSEKKAKSGHKYPYLKISEILKYSREIGKSEQISMVITKKFNESQKSLHILFLKSGVISIVGSFSKSIDIFEINTILSNVFSTVIEKINDSLESIGYNIQYFRSLDDENLIINNMKYNYNVHITKKIDLTKYRNLLFPLFVVKSTNIDKDAQMIFKRVDNYISMNNIDEFITIMRKKTENVPEIINELMKEMSMDEKTAIEHVTDFFGNHKILNGELIDNIGFPINISLDKIHNILHFSIERINNLKYIEIMKTYFDSIIKLYQYGDKMPHIIENIQRITKKEISEKVIEKTKEQSVITSTVLDDELDTDFFGNTDNISGVVDEESVPDMDVDEESVPDMDVDEDSIPDMDVDEVEGGGEDDLEKDVTSMKLNNPNPFQQRIEDRDPNVILKKDEGKYSRYSRTCLHSQGRQPVILNKEEMDKIDKKHRNSYVNSMEYSTTSTPYWYICPRYWSLKDDVSLSQDEVDKILEKEPKAIIPSDAKTIPQGSYIYEFKNVKQHLNDKGEYIMHHPGLIMDSHPDGYGVPCCFKKPQVKKEQKVEKTYSYIVDSTKFPVPENRQGFLPIQGQVFFNNDMKTCISKNNTALLKSNVQCLLRIGTEQNILQSFIGVIASLYADAHSLKHIPRIANMMKIIAKSISIDDFIKFNNASLVSIFKGGKSKNIDAFKSSTLYEYIDENNNYEMDFFKETVNAYENFQKYLMDTSAYIDHTFIWEIISEPNHSLFPNGLNIVIFEINKNMNILCPTNPYTDRYFYNDRKTAFIIKQKDFYELLCLQNGAKTKKMFKDDEMLKEPLEFVEKAINDFCSPKKSIIKYNYTNPISASATKNILINNSLTYKSVVMNLQSKIVGFDVGVFLPCMPSSIRDKQKSTMITNDKLYHDYDGTLKKLNEIYETTENKIPCKPMKKLVHEGYIHGIKTSCNLYVHITPKKSLLETTDELEVEITSDYLEAEIQSTQGVKQNKDFKEVNKIIFETDYYSVFRTIVRVLLNKSDKQHYKDEIRKIIESKYTYKEKIQKLYVKLQEIVYDYVEFTNVNINKISEVTSCFRNCKSKDTCKHKNGFCVFQIPTHNLLQPEIENEIFYFVKLADEIIRVYNIRSFLLDPSKLLDYNNMGYKINDNEVVLVDSLINHDYFNEMEIIENNFVEKINFDIAIPDETIEYSNKLKR